MLGRISVDLEELISAMSADQFTELPVRFAHSVALQVLPRHHDDPFDRLLIAQAIAEGRRLVTRDSDVLDLYAGIDGFNPLRA
jgi:PIN domain nuclease of toxin-antitoxin system